MIGHFLLTLEPEQEDRILGRAMLPGSYAGNNGPVGIEGPCLVGTAAGCPTYEERIVASGQYFFIGAEQCVQVLRKRTTWLSAKAQRWARMNPRKEFPRSIPIPSIESRYDAMCHKYGTELTNRLIRDRILLNRLWRELSKGGAAAPGALAHV